MGCDHGRGLHGCVRGWLVGWLAGFNCNVFNLVGELICNLASTFRSLLCMNLYIYFILKDTLSFVCLVKK